MQTGAIGNTLAAGGKIPSHAGRPDYDFAAALAKVSPDTQAKMKTQAQNFEGTFLNSMFAQMTSGLQGEGPFGNTIGTGIWRSMQIEQYSKSFAQAGGIGIAQQVYRSLILKQAQLVRQNQGKQA